MNEWKLFSPESKIYKILDTISDMVIWNLLWILCSLPLVTIGASWGALYYVNMKKIQKRDVLIKDFFDFFKENLIFGVLYQLAVIGVAISFYAGIRMIQKSVIEIIICALCFMFLVVSSYILPTRVAFQGTWKNILRLSIYFSLKMPFYILLKILLGLWWIFTIYILCNYYITGLLQLLLLFGASISNWICQYVYLGIIKRFGFAVLEK